MTLNSILVHCLFSIVFHFPFSFNLLVVLIDYISSEAKENTYGTGQIPGQTPGNGSNKAKI